MSSQPPTALERAKQGDATAIATLLNRSLQPKGITASAALENGCLQIRLESAKGVSHPALVDYIRSGVIKLELDSVRLIQLSSYQTGNPLPLWEESIDMSPYLGVPDLSLPDDDLPEAQSAVTETVSIADPAPAVALENDIEDEKNFVEPSLSQAEPNRPKSKTGFKKYWAALVAVIVAIPLGFLAWYFLAPKEEPIASQPNPTAPQSAESPTAQPGSPSPAEQSPDASTPDDAMKQAYDAAMDAAVKTQTAATRSDWQAVVTSWESAIALLGQVPADHSLYSTAQQKISEYQRNLAYAQSKAAEAEQ